MKTLPALLALAASGVGLALAGGAPAVVGPGASAAGPPERDASVQEAPGPSAARPAATSRAPEPHRAARGPAASVVRSARASLRPPPPSGPDDLADEVIRETCTRCHNARRLRGNLSLVDFTLADAPANAEVAEKMIRKLRADMMPPPDVRRPGPDTLLALVESLEEVMDRTAARNPDPGVRGFQRLNRPEYARAIRDLLDLEVDAGDWLPADQMSANFDNIADAQNMSPTLLEAYLNAAGDVSRLAVGDPRAPAVEESYTVSSYASQHPWDHVEGAPFGTRGGLVVDHVFPSDGEYPFALTFSAGPEVGLEDIDVSIDGERVALLAYARTGAGADGRGADALSTEPIFVRAGQRKLSVAFVRRFEGPYEDLIRPHDWSMAGGGSGGAGVTVVPHLEGVTVKGPYRSTGVSETASRARIFSCRPTSPEEERPCARRIVSRLATEAYRRPVTDRDVDGLMTFYDAGRETEGFEAGVRTAIEAILASPHFVFRIEREPEDVRPGESYRLPDEALASRLSFFLWGAPPDDELMRAVRDGKLGEEGKLERQARRMLADPRAEALATRFAAQWLRLQDLYKVRPDPNYFPNFDENLADLMRRETELFFHHLVREDRSFLELFDADYTFVNERLALHYGFPGVTGGDFRKVSYPEGSNRRGLLGHGSVLVLTSLANRTSPVLRGKWVMEVLMGTPPPPPPPGVPDLEETEGHQDGRSLTTRERMELHRANPTCNACHRFMDPIGLALDNFDVTAVWRVRENGAPLDTRGDFYDGTPISTPPELADALLRRPIPLVRTFTENLMAYAIGRRVEAYDQPAVRALARAAEEDGYRMSALVLGVVASDQFRMRRAAGGVAQAEGVEGGER